MNLDTERLLGLPEEKRSSPLRVRIPANPYAFPSRETPSKTEAHGPNGTLSERLRNKQVLAAVTLLLLLLVAILYSKTGVHSSVDSLASSPATQQQTSQLAGSPWGMPADTKGSAVLTPASFVKQQAPAADFNQDLPETDASTQPTSVLPTAAENISKALVVAQHREDIAWLQALPDGIQQFIYQTDNATAERPVRVNQGETAVYLQYIVEQYHTLPDAMVFMHAHQEAPHMPDKLELLQKLRWDSFWFANLRYTNITFNLWGKWTGDWLCPQNPIERPPSEEVIWDDLRVNQSRLFAEVWDELFSSPIGPLPQYVHSPCCAEFLVSKQRIHARPLSFYEEALSWLEATSSDRYWAGRIFEYVWHIIFGEPALYHAPNKCELLFC